MLRDEKFNKLLNEHIEKFLSETPLKDHIKEWKILWHSRIKPVKHGMMNSKWDLKLHTHYSDKDDMCVYVVLGVRVR